MLARLLSNGLRENATPEVVHDIGVANMLFATTCCFALVISIIDLMQGHTLPGVLLVIMAATTLLAMFHLNRTGRHIEPSIFLATLMVCFAFWLVSSGGVEGHGYLWLFTLPPFILFTLGIQLGSWFLALLLGGTLLILFHPDDSLVDIAYPTSFRLRFALALVCSCAFAWLAEYARRHSAKKLIEITRQLSTMAQTDALTGLANRRALMDRLTYEQQRSRRSGTPLAIVLCDVDFFKAINDCYGHQCGDYVLREVATTLRANVREQDTVCRWGGEEFMLLLPDTTEQGAAFVAEKLRAIFEANAISYHGIPVTLTLSFGVHQCETDAGLDYHIRKADQKLYMAKDQGRNRVVSGALPDIIVPEGYDPATAEQ